MATGCLYYKRQDGVIVPIVGAASDHGLLAGLGDNDHPQYILVSTKGAANGVAQLDATTHIPIALLDTTVWAIPQVLATSITVASVANSTTVVASTTNAVTFPAKSVNGNILVWGMCVLTKSVATDLAALVVYDHTAAAAAQYGRFPNNGITADHIIVSGIVATTAGVAKQVGLGVVRETGTGTVTMGVNDARLHRIHALWVPNSVV